MRSPSTRKKGTTTECCSKVGLKKGPWTPQEDELLSDYVKREGEGKWRTLPIRAGLLRCGKSCRLRWMNYLHPSVKRGGISSDEEDLILRLHRLLGNKWSLIAGRIPGRTDNEIKNYWNTHLSKKLICQGIDPKTHKPFKPAATMIVDTSKKYFSYPTEQLDFIHAPSSSHVPISTTILSNGIQLTGDTEYCTDVKKEFGRDGNKEVGNDQLGIDSLVPDEAFSSFLNSLINDEMFNNNKQEEQDQQVNNTSSSLQQHVNDQKEA